MSQTSNDPMPVNITGDRHSVFVDTSLGPIEIRRIQDIDHEVTGYWARTSRPCPKSCIQPMIPASGVVPIGELELLDMLCDPQVTVFDSRTPDWFGGGSIPGAVNLPFTEIAERLDELGCRRDGDGWDCSSARSVALFCNGVWCGQSPTAIHHMIDAGFPSDRIHYYRGGMQAWHLLSLTTT